MFAGLPDPESCDFSGWANQLRTLLCEADCQLRNVAVVPCNTDPVNFTDFVGECEDLSSVMVIEQCSQAVIWYHNGVEWKILPLGGAVGSTTPVLVATTNQVVYPLAYGAGANVHWTSTLLQDSNLLELNNGIVTIHTPGWYRFSAACSIRITASPYTGNLTQHFHRARLLASGVVDHRGDFSFKKEHFPFAGAGISFYLATNAVNVDVNIPRDPLPTGIAWWSAFLLKQTGLRYFPAGDTARFYLESYTNGTSSARWGVGGYGVDNELSEYLVVERLAI